eukprot:gene619-28646_t
MPHMLPSPNQFSKAMLELGATTKSHIVAYDASDFGVFSSARLWWMCKVFDREVITSESASDVTKSHSGVFDAAEPSAALLKTHDEIRTLVDAGNLGRCGTGTSISVSIPYVTKGGAVLVPVSVFTGEVAEPRPQLSSGHMPGSKSTLLPPSELAAVFEDAGVDLNAGVVTSCGSGVTACVVTLALEVLAEQGMGAGASRHVYDGSWTQYASDPDSQIVKTC